MSVLQIAGVALLSLGALLLLRELRPTFALPARLSVTLLFFGGALALYVPVVERIEDLFAASAAASYAAPLLRAAGIALICEITSGICRDLGEATVAGGVQLFGKLEILVLCLPLVDDVLEIAKELLNF